MKKDTKNISFELNLYALGLSLILFNYSVWLSRHCGYIGTTIGQGSLAVSVYFIVFLVFLCYFMASENWSFDQFVENNAFDVLALTTVFMILMALGSLDALFDFQGLY